MAGIITVSGAFIVVVGIFVIAMSFTYAENRWSGSL
jgi:hypothetical protein